MYVVQKKQRTTKHYSATMKSKHSKELYIQS